MKNFLRILTPLAFIAGFLIPSAQAEERTSNLFWTLPSVTVGGQKIDFILNIIFWLTLVVFVATQAVYIYYLVKYRRKPGQKAHYSHGNNALEIFWTMIPTVVFLALAMYSNSVWSELTETKPPANALNVDIVGYQFGWDLRYPGEDGKLGAFDVKKITPENKFGVDESDLNAKDDFSSSEFVIPVGRAVHVYLRSRDVIHSFYVPEFRLYQDAVPGRTISWIWFQTTRTGEFDLACSQLCGKGHFNMKARIRVVEPDVYQKWFADKVKAAAAARNADKDFPAVAQK